MENYIKETNKKSRQAAKEDQIGSIQVIIKDHFVTRNIDLDIVLGEVSDKVPSEFLEYIDYIMIGQFKELTNRSVNAAHMDGAIYVTNEQDDENDMIDDLVHEIAHAVEENKFIEIYSDGNLELEFLSKRERLYHMLGSEKDLDIRYEDFKNPEYSKEFDELLFYQIGYPLLAAASANLFYSPYAVTSLREYFASGFETFYNKKDFNRLSSISPILFDKLEKLNYNKERKHGV
jgi:hypothetical protein